MYVPVLLPYWFPQPFLLHLGRRLSKNSRVVQVEWHLDIEGENWKKVEYPMLGIVCPQVEKKKWAAAEMEHRYQLLRLQEYSKKHF